MGEDCWHVEEYGSHCWRPIPNSYGHADGPTNKCDICGATEEDSKTERPFP